MKIKNVAFQNAKWERVEPEQNQQTQQRQDIEWVQWQKGKVIYGYYIGVRKSKNGKMFGLLMKDLPVEEGEPLFYGFSIPVDLRRRLEAVENKGHYLHGIIIECKDIIEKEDGKRMYQFDVQSSPDLFIDESVLAQYVPFEVQKIKEVK